MSFWTLGANVGCAVDDGWRGAFPVKPQHGPRTGNFAAGDVMKVGGEIVCFQPGDWLVKKAIGRRSLILHAYYSSSPFHLDCPLASDISREERTVKFSVMSW